MSASARAVPQGSAAGSVAPWVTREADAACRRIAPLWPLHRFVAVNPFLGLTDLSFHAAARRLAAMGHRALAPTAYYRAAIARGTVTDADLTAALRDAEARGHPATTGLDQLHAFGGCEARRRLGDAPAGGGSAADADNAPAQLASIAAWFDAQGGSRWASHVVDEISKWCAAWFDRGQAAWPMPWQHRPLYAAWREAAHHDREPARLGLRWQRVLVAELPADPTGAIAEAMHHLGLCEEQAGIYMETCLREIAGWAGIARQRQWEAELRGRRDDTPLQLLAIRLAWDLLLARQLATGDQADQLAHWRNRFTDTVRWRLRHAGADAAPDPACLVQRALEHRWQTELFASLAGVGDPGGRPAPHGDRPDLQAVFCIDVRAEVYRRALESRSGAIRTLGCAGFFGFPVAWRAPGHADATAQCPMLIAPAGEVTAGSDDTSAEAIERRRQALEIRDVVRRAWRRFSTSAVSCFCFVESLGTGYLFGLLGGALGRAGRTAAEQAAATRPCPDPMPRLVTGAAAPPAGGHTQGPAAPAAPAPAPGDGTPIALAGLTHAQQVAMAEGALRGMSLTGGFARIVLLCGHASTTTNNPYRSGLDCGACGGQNGAINARIAATVLNKPGVRGALHDRGIAIPADCVFVAALHDTTTDQVSLFDLSDLPASHTADIARAKAWLRDASAACRGERAPALGLDPAAGRRALRAATGRRGSNWAEVRPEWGLARNAAFIAAPRALTRGIRLHGRVFLHDYDWRRDEGFQTLEQIMTAPMIVASWINLQYFASTVNNRAYGSGNKTLHNIVGQTGVLSGNGGDLRVGLPWQSVHDGERFHHEPLRLSVVFAAPSDALDRVLLRHEEVHRLVRNEWLHLFAIDDAGSVVRCLHPGRWLPWTA